MENMENNSQEPKKSGSSAWVWVMIIVAVVAGGFIYYSNKQNSEMVLESDSQAQEKQSPEGENSAAKESPEQSATPSVTPTPSASPTPSETVQNTQKVFTVNGDNFSFSPKEIKVKKGDSVKIVFNNTMGFHDWVIDEFNAKTPQLEAGKSATVEFVADKTGTFEYYCSVGKHRQMGMVGKLIVE